MPVPTPAATSAAPDPDEALARQRTIEQAIAEGHDADTPSDVGYVLDEAGEQKRLQSIADQRRKSLTRRRSQSRTEGGSHDVERDAGLGDKEKETPSTAVEVQSGGSDGKDEEGTSSEDEANVVWWNGPDDPENPYNWPTWRKVTNCTLISAMTFITPLGSSIFAPGVPQLMIEFGSPSPELAAFVVSVYVLGFAAGPMLVAPLSEIYGRNIVYHFCNVCFIGFLVGSALAPTLGALIAFRFLSGVFGSCPLTNGGGSIADMIKQEHRGAAMAAFSIGPLLGPIIGPVAGGFLADAKGWRWVFWVLVIVSGFFAVVMFIFARETFAPVILQKRVDRLRKETGNDLLRSKLDAGLSPTDHLKRGILRPIKMLIYSPICIIFALYVAVVYGYLYLMFTSITEVFMKNYGFSASKVGLVYLGLGIGSMIGLVFFSITSDRTLKKMAARDGQGMKPEYRLWPVPIGAVMLPIGFFIYGWTVEYHTHWIVPIIGHVIM